MAIDDKSSQLSDVELNISTSDLSDVCNSWSSSIMSADLGSIDVSGSFSSLTSNGVGTGYIPSLQNALQKADKLAINITKLISSAAQDQENADNNSSNRSNQNPYGSNNGNRRGNNNNNTPPGGYNSDNSDKDPDVKSDNETEKVELSDEDHVNIVKEFQSILNGDLYDYLFNTEYASKLKEQLLKSPNLSADLKEKISKMDQNELQATLKAIYVSGAMVSDFSKIIVTIFDSDLRNNFKDATVFDSAKSIADVYSYLSKQTNFQEQLKEIYFGTSKVQNVDDKVISFTRNFVDTVATASKVSYEDILSDSKYQDSLLAEIKDLSNTFSVMEGAKSLGNDVQTNLYSKLIIKEGEQTSS